MIYDPAPPPDITELIRLGIVNLSPLPEINKKPMKKLIPFDIEKARAGAKVVTETNREITIINFDLHLPGFTGRYVLGRYSPDEENYLYEIWPISGRFEDGVGHPPNLMLEAEVEEKGYNVSGQCVTKDGKPYFAIFMGSDNNESADDVCKKVADALNIYEIIPRAARSKD